MRYGLGWLVVVALIPLLIYVQIASRQKFSNRRVVLNVSLAGLAYSLINVVWILQTQPESWARISGAPVTISLIVSWILFGLLNSLGFIAFAVVVSRWRKLFLASFTRSLFMLPALWTVCEAGRSWLTSLILWGDGASLGFNWNFGVLGFSAATSPLGFASRIVGLYGLSFLVVALNIALLELAKKRTWQAAITIFAILATVGIGYWAYLPKSSENLAVGITQIHPDDTTYADNIFQHQAPADLMLLPEYSKFFEGGDEAKQNQVLQQNLHADGLAITVQNEARDGKVYSRTVYVNRAKEILHKQTKTFLIPNGEYMPKVIEWVFSLARRPDLAERFKANRALAKGTEPAEAYEFKGAQLGVLACSGLIAPTKYQALAKGGAEVLINLASIGIFGASEQYYNQTKQMARFHALANAKPFLQSAKGGYSYHIDQNGKFIKETTNRDSQYFTEEVKASNHKTIYTRFGEIILPISVAILTAGFWLHRRWPSRQKLGYKDTQTIARTHHRGLASYQRFFGKSIGVKKEIVLDIGAGDSPFAQEVHQSRSHRAKIIRVDLDYRNAKPAYSKYIRAEPADHIGMKDGSVDRIVSSWMLPHIPRDKAIDILLEMFRLAKPGKKRIILFPTWPGKILISKFAVKKKVPQSPLGRTLVIDKPKTFDSWNNSDKIAFAEKLAKMVTMSEFLRRPSRVIMAAHIKTLGSNRSSENDITNLGSFVKATIKKKKNSKKTK